MQDENLRRLLHYSKQERASPIEPRAIEEPSAGSCSATSLCCSNNKDEEVNDAYEATLAPLGVHVIWLKSYDEIETKLAGLYNSTPDAHWRSVYDREEPPTCWMRYITVPPGRTWDGDFRDRNWLPRSDAERSRLPRRDG